MILEQLKKKCPQTYELQPSEPLPDERDRFVPDPEAQDDQAPNDLDVLMRHCLRYDLGAVYRA